VYFVQVVPRRCRDRYAYSRSGIYIFTYIHVYIYLSIDLCIYPYISLSRYLYIYMYIYIHKYADQARAICPDGALRVLEVGCGNGSSVLPLLRGNPNARVRLMIILPLRNKLIPTKHLPFSHPNTYTPQQPARCGSHRHGDTTPFKRELGPVGGLPQPV